MSFDLSPVARPSTVRNKCTPVVIMKSPKLPFSHFSDIGLEQSTGDTFVTDVLTDCGLVSDTTGDATIINGRFPP
jgi:hypothetical protein